MPQKKPPEMTTFKANATEKPPLTKQGLQEFKSEQLSMAQRKDPAASVVPEVAENLLKI